MPGSFVDSNVLLYLLASDEPKRRIAKRLLDAEVTISVQVLNELANVARRKHRMEWPQISNFIEDLLPLFIVTPVMTEIHAAGRAVAARYGFAFYDSLIVAAALAAKCTTLFTEDMQHEQKIGDLRIINPFRQ